MATTTNFFKRFLAKKNGKKNPDWARVEEPDRFDNLYLAIIGTVLTGFLMLLAYLVMSNNMIDLIAQYLASFNTTLTFNERLTIFGMGLIMFINLSITLLFLAAPVSNDDIVEMISDLDSNTQERLVELEHNVTEHLNHIASDQ